jgi:cellulose 1,4-beta-cellobiosidase
MVINKQQGSTPVTVNLANFATGGTAQVWQINSPTQSAISRLSDVPVTSDALSTTVPSQSITLFVIPAGSVVTAPAAPTGLSAATGNGSVTLSWTASGGATSYTVKRATQTGGPYTAIATTSGASSTNYTDSGLTNGTTYYYVVSASNSSGTSANSAQLAATPMAPPAFTLSAAASPNPVSLGKSTTITVTVADTAGALVNGIVQVLVADSNGNTVASQNFTGENLTAGQSKKVTLAFTPAAAGAFRVRTGVFSASWQLWTWNDSAASITVNPALSFSSSASAAPVSVSPGSSTVITFTVKDTGTASLTGANVEMQVFDAKGNAAATFVKASQSFSAGQSHQYSYTWKVPASQAAGSYTVMIGVFNGGWTTDYYWNSSAATVTVP